MLGKCLYLLKKKKEAVSYLHMAYELDGEAIFEEEDPVFIELAKKVFRSDLMEKRGNDLRTLMGSHQMK